MIDCGLFYSALVREGIDFFTGVPDTLLQGFCAHVTDHADCKKHVIAANEGGAIALACGYYLATNRIGLVYMQNSGQGNAANPLISLADPDVYSIPMLILVGWRGEPGKHDEPQHVKQGRITLNFLDTLELPYKVLPDNIEEAKACLQETVDMAKSGERPVALIVRTGTFAPYQAQKRNELRIELTRETAIRTVIDSLDKSDIVVSTTGKISRELYEYRDSVDGNHSGDFLTVGSMGHCSQIALGIALAKTRRRVYCLDGDGAVIMHMGAMAIIGSSKAKNFRHIVLNNGCHDSVGGQPTCGFAASITAIARACGYEVALQAQTKNEITHSMGIIKQADGPVMLEIWVRRGARDNLGRPKSSPKENKMKFMEFLAQ